MGSILPTEEPAGVVRGIALIAVPAPRVSSLEASSRGAEEPAGARTALVAALAQKISSPGTVDARLSAATASARSSALAVDMITSPAP